MHLAIFDLDETLIDGDSDHQWARWLGRIGRIDPSAYEAANEAFYADYRAGKLEVGAYYRFALSTVTALPHADALSLRARFVEEVIAPIVKRPVLARLHAHLDAGHEVLIATATNRWLTAPIAAHLGVPHLLATEVATDAEGRPTGDAAGLPCFQAGKIRHVLDWLAARGHGWEHVKHSHFYSDSRNDLPLLQHVHTPVAVDPDAVLHEHATKAGWEILSTKP